MARSRFLAVTGRAPGTPQLGEHRGRAWMRVDVAVEEPGANLTPHTVEELLGRRPPDAPPPSEG